MKRTIEILKKIRANHQINFITNSMITKRRLIGSSLPDTEYDLDMITELTLAIKVLENKN